MRGDDLIRLRHMLEAARDAIYPPWRAKRKKRSDLDTDRMLVLSLVKSIEIIGEAAAKVTQKTQENFPGIPWRQIVTMRNRLIHVYFDIDMDRIWDTVVEDLPPLVGAIEKILSDEEVA